MFWLLLLLSFILCLYVNRKTIGQLFDVAEELLGAYNDQYVIDSEPTSSDEAKES